MEINELLANEFSLAINYVNNIIALLDEGATIPFIARYRKELTGSCEDQTLRAFDDRLKYLRSLTKRKEEVFALISDQGNMTDDIKNALEKAATLTELEDIYRPFRPKRKTRASVAIAKGLQPLADAILKQEKNTNLEKLATTFVDKEKGVDSVDDAIQGAKDIVAEIISDTASLRKILREMLFEKGFISTKLDKEKENASTYEMYNEYSSEVNKLPSHRILAINRGEKEGCLKVSLVLNEELALNAIYDEYIKKESVFEDLLKEVALDSYNRLIFPSIEREIRNTLTDIASEQAIKMFEVNLEPLLMQPPLKDKIIMGLDPAYRTGCKIAVIDIHSNVLDSTVIYPTPPQNKIEESEIVLAKMIDKHKVDVIAIGNGTATKESEIFVANLIKKMKRKINYAVVNEAGASVYSASKLGATEFPQYDVAIRSAISIARRLQDPLAELIKIDVKSIGVGQYQHDMPEKRLTEVLEGVVESCVNSVGVDINTASPSLLSYVAGLNNTVARNIADYRKQHGMITTRETLKKVKQLGAKAFEQCAGFLRIAGGENILDNTAVHPESYAVVYKLLEFFNLTKEDIINGNLALLPKMVVDKGESTVAAHLDIGVPTLLDIVNELTKPGRDIRDGLPQPVLKSELLDITNLKEGMIIDGVVRNVVDFGVFVDVSVHQDGLVHISEISKDYIAHPSDVLKVGDNVTVKVLSVDVDKKRIALTIKGVEEI